MENYLHSMKSVMIGHAVGDALGVPVEFCGRDELDESPVTDMRGFGSYPVPAGAWSDDTSMTLAALDSLATGKVDYDEIMENFVRWCSEDAYTPTGEMFDIGRTCLTAIRNYLATDGKPALECGLNDEHSNGNGSLMRIHPFVLYAFAKNLPFVEWLKLVRNGSAITHAHDRSELGCLIYAFVLYHLLADPSMGAIENALARAECHLRDCAEMPYYSRIFKSNFASLTRDEIKSTGYVVDTLEAALWCLMTTTDYKSCVLKAVNLGEDTDTVAAVAGGLAGALYGYDSIPKEWRDTLIKRDYIEELCQTACNNWLK
jgi:ADP-ribosylglycohydrolase